MFYKEIVGTCYSGSKDIQEEKLTSHTMVRPSYPALIAIRGLKG